MKLTEFILNSTNLILFQTKHLEHICDTKNQYNKSATSYSSKKDKAREKHDGCRNNKTICSSAKEKYTSRDNKYFNKHRSDPQSSDRDDHFTYKEKNNLRQRSHSKDSNDGSSFPKNQNSSSSLHEGIASRPTTTSNDNSRSQHSKDSSYVKSCSLSNESVKLRDFNRSLNHSEVFADSDQIEDHGEIVSSQPVVIDQILTGNELDLKSFIGENRDDPVISSIEQSLITKVKKPKVAANIFEAKRLMKVRKQIELSVQKKIGTYRFIRYIIHGMVSLHLTQCEFI